MRPLLLSACALFLMAMSLSEQQNISVSQDAILADVAPAQLSAFGFFDGSSARPSAELLPYKLATPLFSDYAEKQRFIYLMPGASVTVKAGYGRIDFPVGTAIVKNFGYPDVSGAIKAIETRVLLRRASGWVALPYVWNADGKDATLRIGGTRVPIAFADPSGSHQNISYAVPNKNQCKQCHNANGQIEPIGPLLGNMIFDTPADRRRLLVNASVAGGIKEMPAWNAAKEASIDARARSYLYVNCAHCHRSGGSASNSGLFFDESATDATSTGIGKRPVAAGRGSGGFEFVIAPGKPEQSILLHRLKSLDPGVAMPELGRATIHREGADLLTKWIAQMPETQALPNAASGASARNAIRSTSQNNSLLPDG